jgi:hypothetical protein
MATAEYSTDRKSERENERGKRRREERNAGDE